MTAWLWLHIRVWESGTRQLEEDLQLGKIIAKDKSFCEGELCRTVWSDQGSPEKAEYMSNSESNSFSFLSVMLSSSPFLVRLN